MIMGILIIVMEIMAGCTNPEFFCGSQKAVLK